MKRKIICSIVEDSMIEVRVLDNEEINVDDIILAKEDNRALSEGKPYVVLMIAGVDSSITSEAMDKLSSKEYREITIAKALVIQSFSQRLVSNFYLRFKRPATPTKVFNDREKAMVWLRQEIMAFKAVQLS